MKHNQVRQVVFPILTAFIWGTSFVAQDICADVMGAFTFNASRYYIATLALLVLVTVRAAAEKKEERPSLSREEKKSARRSSGLVASAAERRSPSPRISSRRAWSPAPTAARPAF